MQRLKSSGQLCRVMQQMERDSYLECNVHSEKPVSLIPVIFANAQRIIYPLLMVALSLVWGQQSYANVVFNNSASSPAPSEFGKKSLLDSAKLDSSSAIKSMGSAPKFIPAEQAFKLVGEAKDGKLNLDFQVTPGYYLYQRRFGFTPETGTVKFQDANFNHPAQIKDDPEFGKVPVFHDDVSVTVPYSGSGKVIVRWQGCADAGLCYPPQDREFTLPASVPSMASMSSSATSSTPTTATFPMLPANSSLASGKANTDVPLIDGRPDIRTNIEKSAGVQSILIPLPTSSSTTDTYTGVQSIAALAALRGNRPPQDVDTTPSSLPSSSVALTPPIEPTVASAVVPTAEAPVTPAVPSEENNDPFGLSKHPLTALVLLFFAGLGLAFTPCVLPMLPIVANLVARQHRRSMKHGLLLSGAYAVGIASCYAVLGAAIATFGQQFNLLGWLQNPIILIGFAIVFVVLALASFDVFTLRLPQGIHNKLDSFGQRESTRFDWLKQGSVVGSWLTGFVSALVVSPCVSAPLAGVLLSVSTVGSPLLGAAALFMLGLGLGVPLMILGATEGRFLPKAGDWLNWVRQGFGLLLLGVALVLINRVYDNSYVLFLWAALSMAFAIWFWRWVGRGRFIVQVLAAIVFAWGLVQLAGVAAGQSDPWHPLAGLKKQNAQVAVQSTPVIHSLAELAVLQQKNPRLLVDLTADWCVSCRIMERELFSGQDIKGLSNWTRVKLDVTESNDSSKAVLKSLNLFGPPVLIFYQDGQEIKRVVGETKQDELTEVLEKL